MSPSDAKCAAIPVRPLVVAQAEALGRCIRLPVQNADRKLRFPSSPPAKSPSIAATASTSTAKVNTTDSFDELAASGSL